MHLCYEADNSLNSAASIRWLLKTILFAHCSMAYSFNRLCSVCSL